MKIWLTLKGNTNIQNDNSWCYETITLCLDNTKLKHGVQWGCILSKGQCYTEKQSILTFTFHSLWCIILGITVHNLRIAANYTSLPELMRRHSWGTLKIQIMWKFYFLCKNWKTLSEQKLITFRDEINLVTRNISTICKACLETWCHYSRL